MRTLELEENAGTQELKEGSPVKTIEEKKKGSEESDGIMGERNTPQIGNSEKKKVGRKDTLKKTEKFLAKCHGRRRKGSEKNSA